MIRPPHRLRTFTGFAALVLAGCAAPSVPSPNPVMVELPSMWAEGISPNSEVWPDTSWWQQFQSPELNALVTESRARNFDLVAATARITQAEAQTNIARAARFPSVSVGAAGQNQGALASGAAASNLLFGVSGQVAYEADFWGVARNNIRAAQSLLQSTQFARETVALTITAETANSFFEVLAFRERLAIASRNLETATRIVEAIRRLTENGLSSPLDLAQQEVLIAGQAAAIPALQQQEREAFYRLAVLLGRAPAGFSVNAESLSGLPYPAVSPGLPSELLLRRPDIAQAEANLAAADANIEAARGAFLPKIALTGSGGLVTGAISVVTDGFTGGDVAAASGGTGLVYALGASLLQTIFDGGRRQGQLQLAQAQQQELVADYRKAVFKSFGEVETAINQVSRLAERERLKTEQVTKATTVFDISNVQYREGLIGLLALLQAQQTLFTAQDELVELRLARLQAITSLYRALGGGWVRNPETTAP